MSAKVEIKIFVKIRIYKLLQSLFLKLKHLNCVVKFIYYY